MKFRLNQMYLLSLIVLSIIPRFYSFDGNSFLNSVKYKLNQSPCTRLFSVDGDIGCRTESTNSYPGILFEIKTLDDILSIKKLNEYDLALLVPAPFFNNTLMDILASSTNVVGLIVFDPDSWHPIADGYSPDGPSPQGQGQSSLPIYVRMCAQHTFNLSFHNSRNANKPKFICLEHSCK